MSTALQQARAFSPGSVGNVGVGFDILGHSIEAIGDTATVRRMDAPTVRIHAIAGTVTDLPLEAARNTAGMALIALREALALPYGFALLFICFQPINSLKDRYIVRKQLSI